MKRIIFVTQALWIGGIESALINILNHFDYDKYDVTCMIVQDDRTIADRLPKQCRLLVSDRNHTVSFSESYRYKKLYHLTESASNPSRLHRAFMWTKPVLKWIENRLYIRYINRNMCREHFDTAVIFNGKVSEIAARAISADKYISFYHYSDMRRVYHDAIGYDKSEFLVAVSENTALSLKSYMPEYKDKIITLHNLTDVSYIRACANEEIDERFDADSFHIVSCGRLVDDKGFDIGIEACNILVNNGHRNIHWWIIGGGEKETILRKQIDKSGLSDYIHLVGMKKNPFPYISRCNLYVQPSRIEAFGLTIVEAMILGKPVLSTDTDGGKANIQNGVDGLLCEKTPEAIAGSIAMLKTNTAELKRYQEAVLQIDYEEKNRSIMQKLYQIL